LTIRVYSFTIERLELYRRLCLALLVDDGPPS
jgi:hypothetical protein